MITYGRSKYCMLPASSRLPAADPSSDYQKTPCLEAAERAVKLVGVAVQSSYEFLRSPKSPRTAETARGMRQWCICCCVCVVMSGGRKERVAHTTFTVSVYLICLLLTLLSRQQNESTTATKQYQFRAPAHNADSFKSPAMLDPLHLLRSTRLLARVGTTIHTLHV